MLYWHQIAQGPQDCGLLLLLFTIATEPLTIIIRSNPAIHAEQIGDCVHTLSLYADDILVYLSSPDESLLTLMDTAYGKMSGYKININKSVVMPLKTTANVQPDILFQQKPDHITYSFKIIQNSKWGAKCILSKLHIITKKTKEDC